ncbi:MAG: tRNA (adenosine(37)-N6)-threonylcarbamoyltransferase complex dimerization subunit type 1 TsaB [Rhodospirillales bacterium]
MNVLALDCALSAASAAVWADGTILAAHTAEPAAHIAEALMPLAVRVLAEAGLGFADLHLVAVTVGPGSFTGLRAGIAAARGIALARGLPVAGVTTLEAVAAAAQRAAPHATVLAAIDSRRGDVFVQPFAPGLRPLAEPAAIVPEAAAGHAPPGPLVLAGDGAARLAAPLAQAGIAATVLAACRLPDPADVAALAARRHAAAPDAPPPAPVYLAPPRATLPAAEGRLRP